MTVISTGVSVQAPPGTWNINGMNFDAWLRLGHNSSLTITQHPVETGAAITDHSYVNPFRFNFEIGMTDVVASPQVPGLATRSVNAYQALVQMQIARQLLTLTSKYGNYQNILIESIDVSDNYQTKNAMKATITLLQVILVNNQITKVSANPQATDANNRGQVITKSVAQNVSAGVVSYINGVIPQ